MKKMMTIMLLIVVSAVIVIIIVFRSSGNDDTESGIMPIYDYSFSDYDISLQEDEEITLAIPVFFDMGNNGIEAYTDLELEFVAFSGLLTEKLDVELIDTTSGVYYQNNYSGLDSSYTLIEYNVKFTLNDALNENEIELESMKILVNEIEYDIPVTIKVSEMNDTSLMLPLINFMDVTESDVQSIWVQLFSTLDYNTFVDLELMQSDRFEIKTIEYANVDTSDTTQFLDPPFVEWTNQRLNLDTTNENLVMLKVNLETTDGKAFNPYSSGVFKFILAYDDEEEVYAIGNVFVGSSVIEALREYEGLN